MTRSPRVLEDHRAKEHKHRNLKGDFIFNESIMSACLHTSFLHTGFTPNVYFIVLVYLLSSTKTHFSLRKKPKMLNVCVISCQTAVHRKIQSVWCSLLVLHGFGYSILPSHYKKCCLPSMWKGFNTIKVTFIFLLLFCGQNKVLPLGYHTSFQCRSNIKVFLVTREMALLSQSNSLIDGGTLNKESNCTGENMSWLINLSWKKI